MGLFSAYTKQRFVAFVGGLGGAALMYYTHYHLTQEVVAITSEEKERVRDVLPAVPKVRRNEPKVRQWEKQLRIDGRRAQQVAQGLPPAAQVPLASMLRAGEWRGQRTGSCAAGSAGLRCC